MNTKLTLRMDDSLIESAKGYSAQSGKSVSQIVADYFTIIKNEQRGKEDELMPAVRTLKGILSNSEVGEKDYYQYLEEKKPVKVLLDTNVVLDVLMDRKPFSEHAAAVMSKVKCAEMQALASLKQ